MTVSLGSLLASEGICLFVYCLFQLVTVCTIFVFKLFTIIIKHFGAWADFQISCIMEERRYLFIYFLYMLIYIFAINMIYSFSFDLPVVMLFYSEQNINNS